MEEIVANADYVKFDIETVLEQQLGALPLPFPGMDKSGSSICDFFLKGMCSRGPACPFRHVKGDRTVVCKHWLRGLCKKGDQCEFLHEYDMSKMPECYFYSRFNACSNKECPFLHIDPEAKIKDCPWYDRGFCRHGPNCRHRHTRRVICPNYLCGFCMDGPSCKYMHPKFDLPVQDPAQQTKKTTITCHYCGEPGHKALNCPNIPAELKSDQGMMPNNLVNAQPQVVTTNPQETLNKAGYRPIEQVTCFKCGEKGHYANRCPKGHLAFLSSALQNNPRPQLQQQQQQQQQQQLQQLPQFPIPQQLQPLQLPTQPQLQPQQTWHSVNCSDEMLFYVHLVSDSIFIYPPLVPLQVG